MKDLKAFHKKPIESKNAEAKAQRNKPSEGKPSEKKVVNPPLRQAFNPALRERDMLRQAIEDGATGTQQIKEGLDAHTQPEA